MENFQGLYDRARAAGLAAGGAITPVPMVVGTPSTPFGTDLDPNKKQHFVADGVCGFAWVHMKGNIPFARWAKKQGIARPGYPSGIDIPCRDFDQSMQRKEAYARAFASVLKAAGVDCYAQSRMD